MAHESSRRYAPQKESSLTTDFDYHVTDNWNNVPERIREVFNQAPDNHDQLLIHFENWWYFAPPEISYSLLSTINKDGRVLYVSKIIDQTGKEVVPEHEGLDPVVIITLWGLGSLAVFILAIYWLFNRLAYPVQSLYEWAKRLDLTNAHDPLPDFQYNELNQLAEIVSGSIRNVGQTLEREKEFLGFASHELRTPIAALRSNATLLDKISTSPSQKERAVRDRILRASLTMKGITETLLWLSRNNQEALETSEVDIEDTVLQITSDLDYLLAGKAIEMSIQTQPRVILLPEAAFGILITNIIRNAFQHTTSGSIQVIQDSKSVQVINTLPSNRAQGQAGFGLGLKLIRRIVDRFDWILIEKEKDSTKQMTVLFHRDKK